MIKLINGKGQLGNALRNLINKENPNIDGIIYHTWNFLDKSELIQKDCFSQFKDFVDENKDSKIIFVSTYSERENSYTYFKKMSESYLLNNNPKGYVIKLPNLIGKGICEKFRNNEAKPFGEIELITIEDAAKRVLDFTQTDSSEKILRVKGILIPAGLVQKLILFGRDGK